MSNKIQIVDPSSGKSAQVNSSRQLVVYDGNVSAMSAVINALYSIVSTISGNVDAVESKLDTLHTDLSTIDGHVDGIESDLDHINIDDQTQVWNSGKYSSSQSGTTLLTPSSGKSLFITDVSVATNVDVNVDIYCNSEAAGTRVRSYYLLANMAAEATFKKPLKCPANYSIKVDTDNSSGEVCVIVSGFER